MALVAPNFVVFLWTGPGLIDRPLQSDTVIHSLRQVSSFDDAKSPELGFNKISEMEVF